MKKPSIRLIELPGFHDDETDPRFRHITGGFLVQTPDTVRNEEIKTVTKTGPTDAQVEDLRFAFNVIKHVKSNAIVLAKDGVIVGVGAGQMSRVLAVEIAIQKAGEHAKGAVLASDAFFPFNDSVKLAHEAGITAFIQPGGSKRDQDSIDYCDENSLSMVFTGVRHFKH